jgi:hypothetical protein
VTSQPFSQTKTLATLVVVLGLLSATAAASVGSPVPEQVQQRIKRSYPRLAFVPAVIPTGYRFHSWLNTNTRYALYTIGFARLSAPSLGFHVTTETPCSAFGKPMATFRLNGVRVMFNGQNVDQVAFRCLGPRLVLSATGSVADGELLNTPARRKYALNLARLVAYARRI